MTSNNWRKSTYSSGQGGACVEVGTDARTVAVRDTTQHGRGPVMRLSPADWSRLLESIKH